MTALPWVARASLPPTYACYVSASRRTLLRYRDLPAYLGHLRAVRRQLRDNCGLLGYAFAARLRDRTFWTVSAWADQDAAEAMVWPGVPSRALAVTTSVSWFVLAEELPVGWAEVHGRLAVLSWHGERPAGQRASVGE